ncbi:DUF4307 domain-containing protein [Sinomonas halotolerans]|uniref:DUF4307 domain-containing protein n=1 Tax=Sinomonas halotolerans TaxID=1644133 RepID=A0ABU9WUX2_9MICC
MDPDISANPALAARYGSPRRGLSRTAARVLVAVGLALGIAVAAWLAVGVGQPEVRSKDVGFRVQDPWHAEIDFEVSKDASASAVCAVKALSESYAVVGWKEIAVGPSAGASGTVTTPVTVPLRTESGAVSAVVDSCWITGG